MRSLVKFFGSRNDTERFYAAADVFVFPTSYEAFSLVALEAAASALEYVAGYTVGHDVSARDWQLKKDGKQWMVGKTFDTFAPTGPTLRGQRASCSTTMR